MKKLLFFLALLFTITCSCSKDKTVNIIEDTQNTSPITISTPKWYNGHTAAISITYDGGWDTGGSMPQLGIDQDAVLSRGLVLDYEVVTATYEPYASSQAKLRNEMPLGIHFFGHGHTHVPHDTLSFQDCYDDFRTCFLLMQEWGLNPRAYAYPNGSGREPLTQFALSISGFMCARNYEPITEYKYICPNDIKEPKNWFFLPCIPIASEYDPNVYATNHEKMTEFFTGALENTAWIIPCYHGVGFVGGWGYYPLEDFEKDLDTIKSQDFWCSNMDVIACYIKERNNVKIDVKTKETIDGKDIFEIKFDDELPDDVYDIPVTIDLTFLTGYKVASMHCDPPINGITDFTSRNGKIRVNVIPDSKKYQITLSK
jgi:hypothetical protein